MQMPLQIAYHGVEKTERIDELIRGEAARLEQVCDHIIGCRVVVEQPHRRPARVSGWQVRIDVTVPPQHEIVVRRKALEPKKRDDLWGLIVDAFEAVRRQLVELVDRQQGEVKLHPHQEVEAIVTKLFEEYGFLQTVEDSREIYFHKNSVVDMPFDELTVGTGVNFSEEEGDKGPQASSVRVIEPGP